MGNVLAMLGGAATIFGGFSIAGAGTLASVGTLVVPSAAVGTLVVGAGTAVTANAASKMGDNFAMAKASKKSGREMATDTPSWARNGYDKDGKPYHPRKGEDGKTFADRVMDDRYGEGNWRRSGRQGREYSQLRKWGDRSF